MGGNVSTKHRHCILFLIGLVFAVYFNSLWGCFQFDDYNVIVDEPSVKSLSAWYSGLAHSIRPLLKLTYTLNWVSGFGVMGFHVFNIVVHSINVILIFLLTRSLMTRFSTNSETIAFFTTFLFAIHPVQTEAVTYISGRSSSFMAAFYLGSLFSYDYGVRFKKKLFLYLISPILFIMASAVKETAITLPLALILWESVSGNTPINCKKISRRLTLHWIVFACLIILIAANSTYLYLLAYSSDLHTIKINLLSQINGVLYLMSRIILVNRLNIDPDLPVMHEWNVLLLIEFVFLLMLFAGGLLNYRKRPWLMFGVLWFFLQLLPTNTIIPRTDIANERHLYLPVWGLFMALSAEGLRFSELLKNKNITKIFVVAVMLMLMMLGAFTISRNHVYRSETALWENTSRKSPFKARVYNNLGYAYYLAGRTEEAVNAYRTALNLNPDYVLARNNLARIKEGH